MSAARRPTDGPARAAAPCSEHSGLVAELGGLGERLERIERKLDSVSDDRLPRIAADISALKTRAGLWGLLAGAIGAALAKFGIENWGGS